jgi:hypothetical protein
VSTWIRVTAAAALAAALCFGAGYALVELRSDSWPIFVLGFALVITACMAFAFVSLQLDGFLVGRPNIAGVVHWFAIAILGLWLAALLGIPAAALGPRSLPYVLLEDLGLAVVVGVVLAVTGPLIGAAIHGVLRRLGSKQALGWAGPSNWPKRLLTLLARCLAVAFFGFLLSVGEQAVASVGNPLTGNIQNVYAPIGGWVLGSAIAWRLTTPLFPIPSHHPSRHVVHGVALTILFSVVASFLFATAAAHSAEHKLWSRAGKNDLAQPLEVSIPTSGARPDYHSLAVTFSPELRFHPAEHWFPTSVAWFLKNATPHRDLRRCLHICYELRCDDADGACAESGLSAPTVYVRVMSGGNWPDTEVPDVLRPGWVLLQYWFFYNYDSLRMPVITQWHQGDWEQVTVGLSITDAKATPRFVVYSEHCAGVVLPWSRVEIGRGRTHPLVFVARGSHANYPRRVDAPIRQLNCSLGLTPPRYLGVGDLFFSSVLHGRDVEVPVGYVFGIRDRTGSEQRPGYKLQPLRPGDEIEEFHGFWGRDNNLKLWLGSPRAAGDGPHSPPDQPASRRPGRDMLCNDRWFKPRPGTDCVVFLPPVPKE